MSRLLWKAHNSERHIIDRNLDGHAAWSEIVSTAQLHYIDMRADDSKESWRFHVGPNSVTLLR